MLRKVKIKLSITDSKNDELMISVELPEKSLDLHNVNDIGKEMFKALNTFVKEIEGA